jgi:prefoldin alpha subunit
LVSSQEQLKDAQERFATNVGSLHILTDAKEDQEVMVPLTSSLSVLGKMQNVNRVMIDIGTGYFVEMVNLYLAVLNFQSFHRTMQTQLSIMLEK